MHTIFYLYIFVVILLLRSEPRFLAEFRKNSKRNKYSKGRVSAWTAQRHEFSGIFCLRSRGRWKWTSTNLRFFKYFCRSPSINLATWITVEWSLSRFPADWAMIRKSVRWPTYHFIFYLFFWWVFLLLLYIFLCSATQTSSSTTNMKMFVEPEPTHPLTVPVYICLPLVTLHGQYRHKDGSEVGLIVTHPHPLLGGSMKNNVTKALALGLSDQFSTLCFNTRGILLSWMRRSYLHARVWASSVRIRTNSCG